jgi:hypothetical protein
LTASLKQTNQTGWAITDGSAGLRGEVIKSDNFADIKLFAATFLSGAASALTEKQQTVFGPINSPTLNNAPFAGAQAVLQTYAQQILTRFKRTVSTSACRVESNFISTFCKPLTPPTPRLAARPFPSIPRKKTNNSQPNQDHENVLSHSLVVSLRVFHRAQAGVATTTAAADGRFRRSLSRSCPRLHIGRYVDPNDDLVMHEQHVVYRVEENTRWNFHPGPADGNLPAPPSRDAAFAPAPVNDAILAEVNSQRLATTEIMMQARTLSAALAQFQTALQQTKTNLQETARLRASVNDMKQRLDALETAPGQLPATPISTTNEPADSLSP